MIKLVHTLGIAILAAATLTGCELYFGDKDEGGRSECRADGYYVCDDNGGCEWAGAECPDGGGGGFSCTENTDCAAGCYCQDGVCEEAGFCGGEEQCPDGFHCDVDRSSCEPNTCDDGVACPSGQICENGECTSTCSCANDQEAIAGGYGYCDEATSTCYPGTDPAGSCAGTVTCNIVAPTCAVGEVPLIKDDCYTGACKAIAQCDTAPSCAALKHEPDCLGRIADCSAVYTGIGCTKPDGTQCNAGDTNCTCQSFNFNSCQTRGPSSRMAVDSVGNYQSIESLFH